MVKKEKQQFLMESQALFRPFCPRSRFELLFFQMTIFIQIPDSVCRLHLHTELNEADNIITYQEVLHDVTFPGSELPVGVGLFLELPRVILNSIQQDKTRTSAEGQPACSVYLR